MTRVLVTSLCVFEACVSTVETQFSDAVYAHARKGCACVRLVCLDLIIRVKVLSK